MKFDSFLSPLFYVGLLSSSVSVQASATPYLRMKCGINHASENTVEFDTERGLTVYNIDICSRFRGYSGACEQPDEVHFPFHASGVNENGMLWVISSITWSNSWSKDSPDNYNWRLVGVQTKTGLHMELGYDSKHHRVFGCGDDGHGECQGWDEPVPKFVEQEWTFAECEQIK